MKREVIPAPAGFKAGGMHCGIKKRSKDLALIYSDVPATAAGVFTTNQVQAASVKITKEVISSGIIQAIIANSGSANALTGSQGDCDALEMARITAENLGIDISKVAIASTGTIGKPLPMKTVSEGIERLVKKINPDSFIDAAQAIITTDTRTKTISRKIELGNKKITITAIAKGAGMIYPHMATMLCFIVTDLKISRPLLEEALKNSVEQSFNCISVDGCMSTNDMVLLLANGMAGNSTIDANGDNFNKIQDELHCITKELAKMIVTDGEGVTKLIEIEVNGAISFEDARRAAFSIANYDLLKCSFYGESLNIGRIVAAIGGSPVRINQGLINLYVGDKLFLSNNIIQQYSQAEVSQIMKRDKINIKIDLNQGEYKAVVWSTDLSPKYVKINME